MPSKYNWKIIDPSTDITIIGQLLYRYRRMIKLFLLLKLFLLYTVHCKLNVQCTVYSHKTEIIQAMTSDNYFTLPPLSFHNIYIPNSHIIETLVS